MNEISHIMTTQLAMQVVNGLHGQVFTGDLAKLLAVASADTDHLHDVEFVRVWGDLDDPHKFDWLAWNDQAHRSSGGIDLTALNHYIDIQKGPGVFDDYDGYSFYRGSGHLRQYQHAQERTRGLAFLTAAILGLKVDEGVALWLKNGYMNIPGRVWYRNNSPAFSRYSFPKDLQRYKTKTTELQARFPLKLVQAGKHSYGFPYSIFMPVDNLARYWFKQFLSQQPLRLEYLGPVLHAVQDASVPHHAAGYMGNWHAEYERAMDIYARQQYRNPGFRKQILQDIRKWLRMDASPPQRSLRLNQRNRVPALNWSVEALVTWMALQAYQAYTHDYHRFNHGFTPNPNSQRRLFGASAAVSALVLVKGLMEKKEIPKY